VNGDPRDVEADSTVSDLLTDLGLDRRQLAVERNREIVPRARHADTVLAPDDAIEIVTMVGGG